MSDEFFEKIPNATELFLDHNCEMKELSDKIGELTKLKDLRLGMNSLLKNKLPEEIWRLENLEIIVLNGIGC